MNKSAIAEDILFYVYPFINPNANPVIYDKEYNVESYTEEAQEIFDGIYDILGLHEDFENTAKDA